jgi:hypothetical protein
MKECKHDPCACLDAGMTTGTAEFCDFIPSSDACKHDFQGWREFDDGNGGEQVCTKCGMGAMTYSLRYGP